jgi:hypothetical protein
MAERKLRLPSEPFYALALVLLIVAPFFVFGSSKTLYVDQHASGKEDGSQDHPYHKIGRALDHAQNGTTVIVKKGEYNENITVPSNVKLVGRDREDVVIDGDNDEPTVRLHDNTELSTLTVTDGKHGIQVDDDAKTHIYNVTVKSSEEDGIYLKAAPRDKSHRALIDNVWVKESGRAGLYAEKRQVDITKSTFEKNDTDGLAFAKGVKASVEHSRLHDNRASGMSAIIDGASIWTKDNSIRYNRHEGIELNAYGANGDFGIRQGSIVGNSRYGIARVARTGAAMSHFGNFVYQNGGGNKIYTTQNQKGLISPILRLY